MNKIEKLLFNIFKDEKLNDYNGIGKGELIYTYKMQLFIIASKSLEYKEKGIGINYIRYKEEMTLLKYYLNGWNKSLEDFYKGNISSEEDDSTTYRILPIIIANKDIKIIEEEILKNIILITTSPKSILNGLMSSYVFFEYLKEGSIDREMVKDYIIKFSIKDYSEKLDFLDKKFIVNFERERINLLEKIDNNLMKLNGGIYKINENIVDIISKDNYYKLIESFSNFLLNLKRGSIDIESLERSNSERKFKIREGNVFEHYLLGKSKIVKNNESEFYVKTKYGLFKFRKI
ncbi:MAG: hypothetical protein SCJ93_07625 [Bacillota bacterium]|nr:hypothetical protein [Bacillota bacterium]